jgi:hypothetical protein
VRVHKDVDPPTYPIPGFSEPFCSISHLLACGVFTALGYLLLRRGWGHPGRVVALGVFASSCVLLLSMSGVYRGFRDVLFPFLRNDDLDLSLTGVPRLISRGDRDGVDPSVFATRPLGTKLKSENCRDSRSGTVWNGDLRKPSEQALGGLVSP